MASKILLQDNFKKPYELPLFISGVLKPVFADKLKIFSQPEIKSDFNQTEVRLLKSAKRYGQIELEDGGSIDCFEIVVQPNVVIEENKVSIQQYIRKLLIAGEASLVNFVQQGKNDVWRFSLVAKESKITTEGVTETATHSKRYTYLVGPTENCRTVAERLSELSALPSIKFEDVIKAFSVEKLSKLFFDEYKFHYEERFVPYLTKSNFKSSVFNGDEKAIRDFTKKLLGRIVFLYFVQKKGWLGASSTEFASGGNDAFYPNWLSVLFFDTLNNPDRKNDGFKLPDGKICCIPFLNGGLFDKEEQDKKPITFKAALFHNKKDSETPFERGFFDFLNSFNFTIYEDSPDDHTVAVDPEMLGHIFENLLEDNKDKGAYYTPKEIVHYMCQESLIEYLSTKLSITDTASFQKIGAQQTDLLGNEGKTGQLDLTIENKVKTTGITRTDVEQFIKHKQVTEQIKKHGKEINKCLDEVKICDPAIGSGAFPMGLLHEIFNAKLVLNQEQGIDAAKVKQNIIQSSIYGVDIEKGAVDIARLRFWLSLIVDEHKPRPLPNLDYKIVVGDSLVPKFEGEVVDIDWDLRDAVGEAKPYAEKIRTGLKEIVDTQKKFFSEENPEKKKKISEKIRGLKIDLLINQLIFDKLKYQAKNSSQGKLGFTEKTKDEIKKETDIKLKIAGYDKTIKKLEAIKSKPTKALHFFDWKLDFPEIMNPAITGGDEGFDIVIGNPPYINIKNQTEETRTILKKHFKYSSGADIYVAFIEKALTILRTNHPLTLIVPNKFFGADYGKAIREYLKNNIVIKEIWDLKDVKVFENAQISTIVIQFLNQKRDFKTRLKLNEDYKILDSIYDSKNKIQIESSDSEKGIIDKVLSISTSLSEVADVRTGIMGFEYWKMEPIIKSNGALNSKNVPIYTNGNLSRYVDRWEDEEISLYKDKYTKPTIRLDEEFLNKNTITLFKTAPKIIVRGVSKQVAGIIDNRGSGLLVAVHSIIPRAIEMRSLLGIINSKFSNWYHLKTFYSVRIPQGSLKYPVEFYSSFPIPRKFAGNEKLSALVEKVIDAKARNKDTSRIEFQIDSMVYKLYQLAYGEVLVVDKEFANQMSKEEYDKLDYGFEYIEPQQVSEPTASYGKKKGRNKNIDLLSDLDF
jgi:adenine-specific DNA-methyltransferase